MIALDSNVVIDVLRKRDPVRVRLSQARAAGLAMCLSSLAFEELMFGVYRQTDPRRGEEALRAVMSGVDILPFEISDADFASATRARMAGRGLKAPHVDFLIGAHALSRGHTLVTANTRDFANIPGLELLDWRQPPEELQD